MAPLVIYDNQCYLCIKFAKILNFLARGKILLVGHYTKLGEEIRSQVLDSSALEMFWFVDGNTAYGGRAALVPLISAVIQSKGRGNDTYQDSDVCSTECKNVKAAFVRSASLLTHSKKLTISSV